jgi:putative oxidoreductase
MFTSLQNPLSLLGRALLALLFLGAGFSKLTGFAGTVGYIVSKGVPMPELAAAVGVGVELGLGLLLLAGFQTRWAALGLAVFTLVVSFIFHNFWAVPADQMMAQSQQFLKNMAIVGGLLTVAAWGAGAWSLDNTRRASRLN